MPAGLLAPGLCQPIIVLALTHLHHSTHTLVIWKHYSCWWHFAGYVHSLSIGLQLIKSYAWKRLQCNKGRHSLCGNGGPLPKPRVPCALEDPLQPDWGESFFFSPQTIQGGVLQCSVMNEKQQPLRGLQESRVATREESGVLGFPSRRGLTPGGASNATPRSLPSLERKIRSRTHA